MTPDKRKTSYWADWHSDDSGGTRFKTGEIYRLSWGFS